ncbi:MAG: hypothetical protein A2Y15_05335 [Clostridiales bacterium GWF2_36_10]|nr:MAG: hypothetical protein A2Y15_05335 [Clostridiales bacterium GWF2_36_10]HAN20087.1 alpha/beta hydrolase [Clostridiales bacterium]
MPRIIREILISQMRLARPIFKRMELDSVRKYQDFIGTLQAKILGSKVRYLEEHFDGFKAEWAIPQKIENDNVVLYLHGGSYTAGSLTYAKGFGGVLANKLSCRVLCVGYRLAPEFPFPSGLNDAVSAYKRILEKHPAKNISFIGESAGGGMCFALCLKLKEEAVPLPACVVALSPWTDLTFTSKSYQGNSEHDPSMSEDSLRYSAKLYFGNENPKNPLISPIYGDLEGLPPCFLIAGNSEILEDDTRIMAEQLMKYGVKVKTIIAEGMWHVYVLFKIAEAKQALEEIKIFISENCLEEK